jgi:hypothetical protein
MIMLQIIIRIKGSIDPNWSDWLADMQITLLPNQETLLTGDLPDQAALYGVLSRLRDLGLALLAVQAEEMQEQREN